MICSPNEKNIAGQKFGKLTAIKRDFSKESKRPYWFFQCDCGNIKSIGKNDVVNGNTTSCTCESLPTDITGQKFNRLTAIAPDISRGNTSYWKFLCDCGNICTLRKYNVVMGKTNSCGCYVRESAKRQMTIHGLVYHELYGTWSTMKKRCYKEYNKDYPRYGGRGIRVCKRWLDSFANFLEDMGERPQGCTLDRINNNGDYEPGNCRWAESIQQNSNRSGLRQVEINGIVYNTVAEASRATGLSRRQIYYRYINFK